MLTIFVFSYIVGYINQILSLEYVVYILERGLSGRDEINQRLMSYMLTNPLHVLGGCGAGCIDSIGAVVTDGAAVRDSTNVVGILFEYGIVGLLIYFSFICYFVIALYKIFVHHRRYNYYFLIPIPFILNPSETSLINFNSFTTIMTFTIMISAIMINLRLEKP